MNLFDYLMTTSLSTATSEIVKNAGDNWKHWKDFPENEDEMCAALNLENDGKVKFYTIDRGSYIDVTMHLCPFRGVNKFLDDFAYEVDFSVENAGKTKPRVGSMSIGGYHGEATITFKNLHECVDHTMYDISNDALGVYKLTKYPSCRQDLSALNNAIVSVMLEVWPYLEKTVDAFKNGEYEKVLNNLGETNIKRYFDWTGMFTPNFFSIVNLMYLAKKKFDYDLSVEDAANLCWLYGWEYEKGRDDLKFVGTLSYWSRKSTNDAISLEMTNEEFAEKVKSVRNEIHKNTDELAEYETKLNEANKFIYDELCRAVDTAARKFGVKRSLLMLNGFTKDDSWKLFANDKKTAPENWRA